MPYPTYEEICMLGSTGKTLTLKARCLWRSPYSFIDARIVDVFDPEEMYHALPCGQMASQYIDGLPIHGKIYLALSYDGKMIQQWFFLADLEDGVILGRNVLNQ